jgi:hypothetical protein
VFAIDDAASTAAFFCGAVDNSDNSDGYEGRSGSREDEESGFLFFASEYSEIYAMRTPRDFEYFAKYSETSSCNERI